MIVGKVENGLERGFVKHCLNCLLIADPKSLYFETVMMNCFTFDTFDFVLHYLLLCTLPAVNGTYAYIEASLPRNVNDTARLISALMPANSRPGVCLSFWYHMYGPNIDTLSVYAKVGGLLGSAIWKRTGNQANKWKYGQVFIRMALSFQVGCEVIYIGLINTICQSTD